MPRSLTANDLVPLVACLAPQERIRFLRLITFRLSSAETADAYGMLPPARDEFANDEEPLAWDAGGWGTFEEAEST